MTLSHSVLAAPLARIEELFMQFLTFAEAGVYDLSHSKVLAPGLAYKKDIDDLRESPSLTIIELLQSAEPTSATTIRILRRWDSLRQLLSKTDRGNSGTVTNKGEPIINPRSHISLDYSWGRSQTLTFRMP